MFQKYILYWQTILTWKIGKIKIYCNLVLCRTKLFAKQEILSVVLHWLVMNKFFFVGTFLRTLQQIDPRAENGIEDGI